MIWCAAPSCLQRRHDATMNVVQWMRDNHITPSLEFCFTQLLQKGADLSFTSTTSKCVNPLVREAGQQLDAIGFMNFFRGRLSSLWLRVQDSYMLRKHVPTRRRGKSWTASFIRQLYGWSRSMWNHCNDIIHRRDAASKEMVLLSDTE